MSNWDGYDKIRRNLAEHDGWGDWCASSCANMFIGGVDRVGQVRVHRGNKGLLGLEYNWDERGGIAYFAQMDPGAEFGRASRFTSGQSITPVNVARFPRYNIDYIIANCQADPEVLQNVEAELQLDILKLSSQSMVSSRQG
jgi:hypothetical protein